jgi:hypothetical protein
LGSVVWQPGANKSKPDMTSMRLCVFGDLKPGAGFKKMVPDIAGLFT